MVPLPSFRAPPLVVGCPVSSHWTRPGTCSLSDTRPTIPLLYGSAMLRPGWSSPRRKVARSERLCFLAPWFPLFGTSDAQLPFFPCTYWKRICKSHIVARHNQRGILRRYFWYFAAVLLEIIRQMGPWWSRRPRSARTYPVREGYIWSCEHDGQRSCRQRSSSSLCPRR